jgi:hypothetical protein
VGAALREKQERRGGIEIFLRWTPGSGQRSSTKRKRRGSMEDEQPRQGLNPRTMRKVTVSLIGEQPIPNLLPLRHQPPDVAVLVHTGRTENVARRLQRLLQPIEVHLLPTDPYDVQRIQEDLSNFLAQRAAGAEFEFNLTGGTKTMMVAAYEIARKYNAPFLYLQSEGKRSILYRYRFL